MSKWTSDSKQRRSRKYQDLHAQLRREAADGRRVPVRSPKQVRKAARAELFRLASAE